MKNYNIIIDKYIRGDLDIDEMHFFEQSMVSNPKLRNEYLLYSNIDEAILEDDVMMLRGTLDTLYNELEESKIRTLPSRLSKHKIYYAAASLALLIATGSIVYEYSQPRLTNSSIYDKYFTPYEVSVTYRSGNEEIDRLLINALESYEDHDFQNAVILFEKVLEKRSTDMAANLYSGISLMETEKYLKASKSFQTIITNNNNLFIEQSKWYLAMCYIRMNNTNKAKTILNELVNEDSFYKKPARKVLKELK